MAACAAHPDAEAVGTCSRCGRFHCAAVLGIIALARVDTNATPPIGNVSSALAAIVFSLIVTGIYGLAIASAALH